MYNMMYVHMQIMTSYALQRRATDCGITVSSVNPGMVSHIYCIAYVCVCMRVCVWSEILIVKLLLNPAFL